MTIDEAIALLEELEKKAKRNLDGRTGITLRQIERMRLLLANLRT